MKNGAAKQFVIYSRKSKFTGKGESIENQIETCRRYIAAHHGEEAAEAALVYEDEGFSGGTLERPKFKKMMSDSQRIAFAAIVVYRLDRISRNIGDFARLIEDLGSRHVDFISVREQFDTSSPMGRAMMYIASVFSQLERETIAERIRDNMHELSKTGRWLGGNTPTGYASECISTVTVDGKTRKACKLKAIPDEIGLVKLIFDTFIKTGSLTKTDEFLMNGHYQTKRGKAFTRFAIRGILSNPVYMIADDDAYHYLAKGRVELFAAREAFDGKHGIMAYNRTLQRPGKTTQERPMNEWIVSVGKHQGVISGAEWVQVQELLARNTSKSYRRPRSHAALLSGLLYCGKCGGYMRPKLSARRTATGEAVYTYLCTAKERSRSQVCNIKNASGNALDAQVLEAVGGFWKPSAALARQIAQAKKRVDDDREGYEAEVERVRAQIGENEKSIAALVLSLGRSVGSNAEAYVIAQIDDLHERGEALKGRLAELEALICRNGLADDAFEAVCQTLASPRTCMDSYTVEQKRAAIRTVVRKIVWDGESARIRLLHSADERSPALSHQNDENSDKNGDDPAENTGDGCEPLGEDSE